MNQSPRLQRLEALLDRVRRRAAERAPESRTEARPPKPSTGGVGASPQQQPFVPLEPQPSYVDVSVEPVVAPPPVVARAPEADADALRWSEPAPAPAAAKGPSAVPTAPPGARSVPVAAAASSASEIEVVETPPQETLGEEDIIDEISPDMLESIPPSGGDVTVSVSEEVLSDEVLGEDEFDEELPASSKRPKSLIGLGAEAGADALLDEEREVPLKTPPPESGPQAAPPPAGLGAPPAPDVEAMLDAADFPPAPPGAAAPAPTIEQLGQTIELEEGAGGPLELEAAATPAPPRPPSVPEELEVTLPIGTSVSKYASNLYPREGAEPQARGGADAAAGSEVAPPAMSGEPARRAPIIPEARVSGGAEMQAPEVFGRPPLESGTVVRFDRGASSKRPNTFLELLDASITLGDNARS